MLLAICTAQIKKRVKKRFKKKEKKLKVTKSLLQGDSNPDAQNQLELKVSVSNHWITSVNADDSCLYISSLWRLTVFMDDFFGFFNFRVELNL